MGGHFGKNYPALVRGVGRADERERLFFFAAAGLAAFLFFTVIFVLNFKQSVTAREIDSPAASLEPAAASIGTVTLLAPERFVRAQSRLSEIRFKEVYWPRNQVPQEAIRDQAELRDMYASVDIPEGMPIQRQHLSQSPIGVTLPLTQGNRAVSIEVDATSGLEGWALPGTHVDVVLASSDSEGIKATVIVENARVLSYGGDQTTASEAQARGEQAAVREAKRTITLDVAPADALRITAARELGRLSLVMRSHDDIKTNATREVGKSDILVPNKSDLKKKNCSQGTVKINGKDFIMDCNGSLQQMSSLEP